MVVYLDLVFIVNFLFDLVILYTCSKVLKIYVKIWRLVLGSFVGSLTIFSLFLNFNSVTLFIYKIIVSLFIIIVSFGKRNLLKKIYYFYFVSIIIGGFIYFVKIQLSYTNTGLVFTKSNISISLFIYFFASLFMLYSYLKQINFFKVRRNMIHVVTMIINGKTYKYNGYIDTGNSLYDPFKKRPVLILYDDSFVLESKYIYVSYNTLDSSGVIPCVKIDNLYIDNDRINKEFLLGIANKCFKIRNVDANIILHKDLLDL